MNHSQRPPHQNSHGSDPRFGGQQHSDAQSRFHARENINRNNHAGSQPQHFSNDSHPHGSQNFNRYGNAPGFGHINNSQSNDSRPHNNLNHKNNRHPMNQPQRGPQHWNNGPDSVYSHDNFNAQNNNNFGTHKNFHSNNFNQPPPPRRATKRRYRHDLPGPAGAWFRNHLQKTKRRKAGIEVKAEQTDTSKKDPLDHDEAPSSSVKSSSGFKDNNNKQMLFHDYSSHLQDCSAWNYMCRSMDRIVPPFNAFSSNLQDSISNLAITQSYKNLLRSIIPSHQGLVHEIHNGKYDVHHLTPLMHANDLRVPLLFGYVASVSCHAHSDWTAVLVDESYACGNPGGRGIVCWLEEKLVKRHPSWIRPGVVWMLEGAKLALFASNNEDESEEKEEAVATTDISPSTDAARGGNAIDRMILVGESSLVHVWTPEEARDHFGHREFLSLVEQRCNVNLSGVECDDKDATRLKVSTLEQHIDLTCINSPMGAVKSKSKTDVSRGQGVVHKEQNDISSVEVAGSGNDKSLWPSGQSLALDTNPKNQQTRRTRSPINPRAETKQIVDQTNPVENTSINIDVPEVDNQLSIDLATYPKKQTSQVSRSSVALANISNGISPRGHYNTNFRNTSPPQVQCNSGAVCLGPSSNNEQSNGPSHESSRQMRIDSVIPKKATNYKPPESTPMTCPPSSDSFDDSLDVDDDVLLGTTNNPNFAVPNQNTVECPKDKNPSHQQKMTASLPAFPESVNVNHTINGMTAGINSNQSGIDTVTPKKMYSSKPNEPTPMRCPPSGDSFDSLDIDDDALFGNIPNFHTSKQSAGDPEDVGKVEDQNVNSSAFRHTST